MDKRRVINILVNMKRRERSKRQRKDGRGGAGIEMAVVGKSSKRRGRDEAAGIGEGSK